MSKYNFPNKILNPLVFSMGKISPLNFLHDDYSIFNPA